MWVNSIYSMAECFLEKSRWCWNEQGKMWSVFNVPTDWILRYIKTYLLTFTHMDTDRLLSFRFYKLHTKGLCEVIAMTVPRKVSHMTIHMTCGHMTKVLVILNFYWTISVASLGQLRGRFMPPKFRGPVFWDARWSGLTMLYVQLH